MRRGSSAFRVRNSVANHPAKLGCFCLTKGYPPDLLPYSRRYLLTPIMRKLIPLMPLLALTTDPVSGQSASPAQVTSQTQPRLSASSAPSSSTSPATSSPVSLADILIASSPSRCSGSNPCGLLNTTLLACQANDPTCACNNTLTLQAQHCAQCIKSQAAIQQYNAYLTSCVSAGLASPTTTISVDLSSPSATIPSFSASGGPTQPSSPALTSQAASPPCDDTLTLGDTVAPPTIQSQSLPAGAAASPPSPPAPPSIAPPSSNPGLSINPTDGSARLSQTGANNRPAAPSASDQNLVAVPTTPAANSGDTAIPQATSGTVPATGGKGTLAISTPQDSSTGTNDTEASGLKSNSTNLLTVPQGDHNASLTSNTTSSANAATTQAQPSTAALNATVAFFSSSVPADCISQCQSWRSLSTVRSLSYSFALHVCLSSSHSLFSFIFVCVPRQPMIPRAKLTISAVQRRHLHVHHPRHFLRK